jgi:twinkle protein
MSIENVIGKVLQTNIIKGADVMRYAEDDEIIAKVVSADEWRDELVAFVKNPDSVKGAKLPWGSTHSDIRFRTGETTIWAGINGHGKSQLLGMASIGFMRQLEPVLIISLEMKPISTLMRMLRQAAMTNQPSEGFVHKFMDFMVDGCYIFNHVGSANPKMIYAAIRYAARERGVKHVIIDSLMKCVKGEDDYNGQKDFINMVTVLARDYDVHCHVVHHVRKGDNEERLPGKFDLRGTSAISDLADQILTVWRNKKKERALEKNPTDDDAKNSEDAILMCDKNRHGEWEGAIRLWYHAPSLQYVSDKRRIPVNLLEMPI